MQSLLNPIATAQNIIEIQLYQTSELGKTIKSVDDQFEKTLHNFEFVTGFCNICQEASIFHLCPPISNFRESFRCAKCDMINRNRTHLIPIIKFLDLPESRTIWIAECNTPMSRYLLSTYQDKHNIITSSFSHTADVRHENIECLSFKDNSIDLIITADVMEHVNDPNAAWKECFRVLKPGGQNIFTVPVNSENAFRLEDFTITRCKLVNRVIEHYLTPPEWHGGTCEDDGGWLAFTNFTFDILTTNKNLGYQEINVEYYWNPDMMIRGARSINAWKNCIFKFVK